MHLIYLNARVSLDDLEDFQTQVINVIGDVIVYSVIYLVIYLVRVVIDVRKISDEEIIEIKKFRFHRIIRVRRQCSWNSASEILDVT